MSIAIGITQVMAAARRYPTPRFLRPMPLCQHHYFLSFASHSTWLRYIDPRQTIEERGKKVGTIDTLTFIRFFGDFLLLFSKMVDL